MKPNNKLSYIHRQSNHPPALLKNVPLNINKRLTNISSSKEVFDESIAPYQHALKESGYDHRLTYNPGPTPKNKRKRKRDILWYNLPFDSSVKTNLGRKFLHIVEKCFLNNHPLYKIFNRHTQAKLLKFWKSFVLVTKEPVCKCMAPDPRFQVLALHNGESLKAHLQPTGFPTVCFCYGNSHCLSQRSDWMNFSFGWIFMYESCSTARKACRLKFKFDISQTWFFFPRTSSSIFRLNYRYKRWFDGCG